MNRKEVDFLDRAALIRSKIFDSDQAVFNDDLVLELFRLQTEFVEPYFEFIKALNIDPDSVKRIEDIPFLPIEFFKSQKVKPSFLTEEIIFKSSSTTGQGESLHYVYDLELYTESFVKGFQKFYGDISEFTIFALLPNYLERDGSSLVYMMDKMIGMSADKSSGFFLHDHSKLIQKISDAKNRKRKILLVGVTYALLDLAEQFSPDLSDIVVMETGGMKGKRRELLKEELHLILKEKFKVEHIHSEYGMTELLSQAYAKKDGIFQCPSWMRVMVRDLQDPLKTFSKKGRGGINVIDMANVYSCSFIATQDIGIVHDELSFEIKGRMQDSDIRGCNLLIQ